MPADEKLRDAAETLGALGRRLGRPLGEIDMGGPCNKSGYVQRRRRRVNLSRQSRPGAVFPGANALGGH